MHATVCSLVNSAMLSVIEFYNDAFSSRRKIRDLTQELKTAAERADKADHTIKQAKADSTRSAMVRQNLESDLVALRKHLVSLQSALAKVTKQQQVSRPAACRTLV